LATFSLNRFACKFTGKNAFILRKTILKGICHFHGTENSKLSSSHHFGQRYSLFLHILCYTSKNRKAKLKKKKVTSLPQSIRENIKNKTKTKTK